MAVAREQDAPMTVAMAVEAAIRTRRAIRAFRPDPVPLELVEHLLDLAARAPSGTNIQPWHAYAVAGEAKRALGEKILERRLSDPDHSSAEYHYYPTEWHEPYVARRRKVGWDLYNLLGIGKADKRRMFEQQGRNYLFFDAPVGIFLTMERTLEKGSFLDLGIFLGQLMIAARGFGLHTCPQASWCRYQDVVREEIGMPPSELLVCAVALGYEKEDAMENRLHTDRVKASEFCKLLGFS